MWKIDQLILKADEFLEPESKPLNLFNRKHQKYLRWCPVVRFLAPHYCWNTVDLCFCGPVWIQVLMRICSLIIIRLFEMSFWIPGGLAVMIPISNTGEKKQQRKTVNKLPDSSHPCSSSEQWLMHSPSQQSCKIEIISYTEEEPKAQKDSHPPCPAAVLPLRSQYQSPINASRQRLRIILSPWGLDRPHQGLRAKALPGSWTRTDSLGASSSCCCGN